MIRRATCILLAILMMPLPVMAGPAIPGFYGTLATPLPPVAPTQLPALKPGGSIQGLDPSKPYYTIPGTNKAIVNQVQSKAIIDWNEFNIGKDAWVYFDQKDASWAALNRIWDRNPTQIYGTLTAPGTIYLINQNGILFSPTAQVNVHSLIASSLNITSQDFINGVLKFSGSSDEDINGERFYDKSKKPGTVAHHGTITTTDGGSVFLIGTRVENSGSILANLGQIGLVAGKDVELGLPLDAGGSVLVYPGKESRTARVVKVMDAPEDCVAWNMEGGKLAADMGLVGMYGRIVNQDGLIRSVTGVVRGGHVELFASDKITTGPHSWITTPVSDSSERIHTSFDTARADVTFSGLDPDHPGDPRTFVKSIEHHGTIESPYGIVTLNAVDRVYLGSGSRISVAGLWLGEAVNALQLNVQMNSSNLRDEFVQKGGVLKGQYVNVNSLEGSAIGDISGALSAEGQTAAERHTKGGDIIVNLAKSPWLSVDERTATGDFIMREGAVVDISGGGIRYPAGYIDTTKLLSGNKIYDIGTADPTLVYDSIMTLQKVNYARFGITDVYEGLYYGSGTPLRTYIPAHTEGNDAGTFSVQARQAVLDGTLLGGVIKGIYQTLLSDPVNTFGDQTKAGLREPLGGTVKIGDTDLVNASPDSTNYFVEQIRIQSETSSLPAGFQPGDALPFTETLLSAAILSNAGLHSLSLAANTTIMIEPDARISLNPGGVFTARARRIEHFGAITAPGGGINLFIETNRTTNPVSANSNYIPLDERIFLAKGSALDVSGERIDNSLVHLGEADVRTSAYTAGGTIQILDKTVTGQGVAIMPGALVDVSGGYLIGTSGKVSGADAGSLTLQGYSLIVNGDLRAHSILGKKGGTISMHAGDVVVATSPPSLPDGFNVDSPWVPELEGRLVFGAGQLGSGGFTNFILKSVNNIEIEPGALITPSLAKLATPVPGVSSVLGATTPQAVLVTPDEIGANSIVLTAGTIPAGLTVGYVPAGIEYPMNTVNNLARIQMPSASSIHAAPGGSVSMTGPYINVAGTVEAPAGTIDITATWNLTLESTARVLAEGYNRLSTAAPAKGLPLEYVPVAGGTVNLTAGADLVLSPGSLVSVSGTLPTTRTVVADDQTLSTFIDASRPGTITLKALGLLKFDGTLDGHAHLDGLPGGTLSVTKTAVGGTLSLSLDDIARFRDSGFDALALGSAGELNLHGSGRVDFGRSLVLDAPIISGSGSDSIGLNAPWITVSNTFLPAAASSATTGNATIELGGTWIDVAGSVLFSGISDLRLEAVRDIMFTDKSYTVETKTVWHGLLKVPGDLTLKAARIYPTTLSRFTVDTDGKVTVLPGDTPVEGPIYSAGGSLTIQAGRGIEHRGFLAAPMGELSLKSENARVYLAEGSVTTTRGEVSVKYGDIQSALGDNIWGILDKDNAGTDTPYKAVGDAPAKSISISGNEVIMRDGALLDISGGGSVFTYQFLSWTTGSVNPLTKTGRYVIVPDNSLMLPGKAVYLAGGNGIPAGTYSLLPAEYAFLPGALIVTALGTTVSSIKPGMTKEGYTVLAGYDTEMGTGVKGTQFKAYEVRPAADVLKEGTFAIQSATAGDAGRITVDGKTTILGGNMQATPLSGYKGGEIALSGTDIVVQKSSSTVPYPEEFGFSTALTGDLAKYKDHLYVAAPSISNKGFRTIGLGVTDLDDAAGTIKAKSVTVEEGAAIQAENVILGATDTIDLQKNVQILAIAPEGSRGEASLLVTDQTNGKITVGEGALVHASDAINIGKVDIDLQGTLKSDHSELNLWSTLIAFGDRQSKDEPGIFFSEAVKWNNLVGTFEKKGFENIGLRTNDLEFRDSFFFNHDDQGNRTTRKTDTTLNSVKSALTIDTPYIKSTTSETVTLSAGKAIYLLNSSGTSAAGVKGTGVITFEAPEMAIGSGSVAFSGLATLNLNAANDLVFRGSGGLVTGGADLNITTPRVTTSYYMEPAGSGLNPTYSAADFLIDARGQAADTWGSIKLDAGNGTAGTGTTPGGSLRMVGKSIDVSTLIEMPSGQLTMTASESVNLNDGARLLLQGTADAPGGSASLKSTGTGAVTMAAGSLIDVSAGGQGDAGSIGLYAPEGGVTLGGTIKGDATVASGGKGGSFTMVTNSIADDAFGALNQKLRSSDEKLTGFNETIDIRARTGNIVIPGSETVKARNVKLTADGGDITLSGTIDASHTGQGGRTELYAKNMNVSGAIDASGTGTDATGGDVILGVNGGALNFAGLIDVSGTGSGGTVLFRREATNLPSNDSELNMSLSGNIAGASSVVAEFDKVYNYNNITSTQRDEIKKNLEDFVKDGAYGKGVRESLLTNLHDGAGKSLADVFHFRTGAVVQTTGDLTLSQDWDLSSWRFGGEPGTLTLRAGGKLNISGSITDNPTGSYRVLRSDTAMPSWAINLIAGAQTDSADLMAVAPVNVWANPASDSGQLTIGSQKVVYTESGNINFASGGDTVLNAAPASAFMILYGMKYSLATYKGDIRGDVKGNLTIDKAAAIQSALGNIDIRTGGDLKLQPGTRALGAIRTTGERAPGNLDLTWNNWHDFSGGGSITADIGGDINGGVAPTLWLTTQADSTIEAWAHKFIVPVYNSSGSTAGIVAMAGGDVSVRTGGNFNSQAGTFGKGNLEVYAGGDLKGRFYVKQGTGSLSTMGNFGVPSHRVAGVNDPVTEPQLIEMEDAKISIAAQGNIELAAALNPALATKTAARYWDSTYTPTSSLKLMTATGDINLHGSLVGYDSFYYPDSPRNFVLPASLEISAGRDLNVKWGNYVLLPSATGTLHISAGNDIVFHAGSRFLMSDADPASVYVPPTQTAPELDKHASVAVHLGDPDPVTITAGGSITNMYLTVPKAAEITAGGDIVDLNFSGQNLTQDNGTRIVASGNILYGYSKGATSNKIELGGPGYLLVQAGGEIDLGMAENGIQTVGNFMNAALDKTGAALVVAAGLTKHLGIADISQFFGQLREAGKAYSPLLATNPEEAQRIISDTSKNVVGPFLGTTDRKGDISMVSSQIATAGGCELFVIATGTLNVGKTVLGSSADKTTGIYTSTGGGINIFTNGDVNVNESRIMSFRGGDITVWSEYGNINAGRGSKAQVNMGKPETVCDDKGVCSVVINPPAVGSGIRPLTYDPDGPGPEQAPPGGDSYIFSPRGSVDAGEAGISGKNVYIGATLGVLNIANISFSSGSIGVPTQSQGVSLGALTGTTSMAEKTAVSQDGGALGSARQVGARSLQPIEDVLVKWLDMKVISFDAGSGTVGE